MSNFDYKVQIPKDLYDKKMRKSMDLFVNLKHQLNDIADIIEQFKIENPRILIVGVGDNMLSSILKNKYNYYVESIDIDKELSPDIVGSVDSLEGVLKNRYDIIVCCHVLEHLPYEYFLPSLKQIRKFSRFSLVYIPNAKLQAFFQFGLLPIFKKKISLTTTLFFKKHKFNGEHYWEIGVKGHSLKNTKKILNEEFEILNDYNSPEWLYSYNFVLKSKQ